MREITLNIIPGYGDARLKVSQYDKGYEVHASIRKGVEEYTIPTDYTVTVEGHKRDDTGYQYPATFDGSVVTFEVMEQMTVLHGSHTAEIVFYDADEIRVGTANFTIWVEAAPLNENVPISETELPLLQQAITAAVDAADSAERAEDAAERAEAASQSGVTSWNGQTGDVTYTAPVTSVNGQMGAVTVAVPTKTSDLQNDSGFITDAGVTSFNGQSGAVTYTAPVTSVNGMTGDVIVEGGGGGGAVDSVNGQTGDVVLDANDVGALPASTTIPSRTSQLTNDSGFITSAPVQSVNGQTGAVVISVPSKTSDLTNDSGYITGYTETDPTVPAWAKASTKPTYTAAEVGALPSNTVIPTVPTNVSAFTNDAGYLTQHQSLAAYQTTAITDTGGYFTTDTVEAALQELGAAVDGIETLLAAI